MLDSEREPLTPDSDVSPSERVDLPQSYGTWRDYAFSEFPEDGQK